MVRALVVAAAGLLAAAVVGSSAASVPEFEISLDEEPEQRFVEVVKHFNSSLWRFYDSRMLRLAKPFLEHIVRERGPEVDAELAGEIRGVARLTGIDETAIQAIQFLYELQTFMVPIDNVTIPWKGPGCTGIVAKNKEDGMVYHARNLDFSPKFFMQSLTYTGIFTSGGKELFRAHMVAAYSCAVTGMKKGPNGFTVETNTRYPDHKGGDSEMWHNLLTEKRPPNMWTLRKILQNATDYEAAVDMASTEKMIATQFVIMAGVRKGTILSRSPDGVVYKQTLGQPNYLCRDDYIIQTNFDYYWHDVKEFFDYTAHKGIGHSRRMAAQKIMNASAALTPETLFATIDDIDVRATDTIFQAIMNVETGLWNVTLPSLTAEEDSSADVPLLPPQLLAPTGEKVADSTTSSMHSSSSLYV